MEVLCYNGLNLATKASMGKNLSRHFGQNPDTSATKITHLNALLCPPPPPTVPLSRFSALSEASQASYHLRGTSKRNNLLTKQSGLSIRAGSRPKQPATGQILAGYFRLTLLLILVRNLK